MKNHNHSCLDRERILFITLIALTALLNTRRGLKFSLTVSKRSTSLASSLFIQMSFSASVAVGLSFGLSERHFCMNDLATYCWSAKVQLYYIFFFLPFPDTFIQYLQWNSYRPCVISSYSSCWVSPWNGW